jgi:NAD(P)H-flavin reductase/ferredoxin
MFDRFFKKTPKTFNVQIEPYGKTLLVDARETILEAALKSGIAYPHECQVGTCTSCKSQLVEGEIKALTDFSYVLDSDEMKAGMFLACQTRPKSALIINVPTIEDGSEVVDAINLSGKISSITPLTHDIDEVTVSVAHTLKYCAGQYANLSIPGISESRSYSFSNAPSSQGSNLLKFHIRKIPGGEVSGWLSSKNRIGETLRVEGPFGVFRLRKAESPILCIAGGSGMAPIKAILEQALITQVARPVVFLYGARTQKDLYDASLIDGIAEKWNAPFRFIPILSAEAKDTAWAGARGLVADFITSLDDFELSMSQAYLCGPPPMIDTAISVLNTAGVTSGEIFYDKFTDRSHLADMKI